MEADTERLLYATCSRLWTDTYGKGMKDADALKAMSVVNERLALVNEAPFSPSEEARVVATTKWIDCGTPRLITTDKYAAALMCTRVTEPLVEDIIIPWKAFRVDLPRGLLAHDEYTYSHILIAGFDEDAPVGAMLLLFGERLDEDGKRVDVLQVKATSDLAALLLDREHADDYMADGAYRRPERRDAKERATRLATRLVVGLLYTMQYSQDFKTAKPSLNDNRKAIRSGPPKHRTIFVGKPLALDARPALREYVGGKGGAPSVQSLVRGHFKRQVVGVARSGRKVIWVEPYWRGPEDAPILARPIAIGPVTDVQSEEREGK